MVDYKEDLSARPAWARKMEQKESEVYYPLKDKPPEENKEQFCKRHPEHGPLRRMKGGLRPSGEVAYRMVCLKCRNERNQAYRLRQKVKAENQDAPIEGKMDSVSIVVTDGGGSVIGHGSIELKGARTLKMDNWEGKVELIRKLCNTIMLSNQVVETLNEVVDFIVRSHVE